MWDRLWTYLATILLPRVGWSWKVWSWWLPYHVCGELVIQLKNLMKKKKTEKTGIEENDNVRQETDFGWGLLCEPYVLLNLSSFSFTNFGSFIVISIGPTQRKFQNKMLYIVVALEALQNLIFFFFNSVIMFHDCYNNQQN